MDGSEVHLFPRVIFGVVMFDRFCLGKREEALEVYQNLSHAKKNGKDFVRHPRWTEKGGHQVIFSRFRVTTRHEFPGRFLDLVKVGEPKILDLFFFW